MPLTAGSVTVADDETASGSGWAKALYDGDAATFAPTLPNPNVPPAGFPPAIWATVAKAIRLAALRERARQANAYAAANVGHVTANAVVNTGTIAPKVRSTDSVGKVPNPVVAGNPIDPPAADVTIGISGTGTVS